MSQKASKKSLINMKCDCDKVLVSKRKKVSEFSDLYHKVRIR